MPRTKKWLDIAIVTVYLVAVLVSILVYREVIADPLRVSIQNVVDVFGLSDAMSSRSSFPRVAQVYFPFFIWLYPLVFVRLLLAFWAPTLPSYAKRVQGLARVQFLLGGLLLVGMGMLFPTTMHGQDMRLFQIGTSLPTLIVLGWIPFAGGALVLALGVSAVYRALRP